MNTKPAKPSEKILALVEKELPSWFTRTQAVKLMHGLFSSSTLANYQSQRIGPPVHYMGRVACYDKESFLKWLKEYFSSMEVDVEGFSRRVRRVSKEEAADE